VGYDDDEVFAEKVHASDNVAKFIYDPFHMRWRHWRMLFLFQKLGNVAVSVFVIVSTFVTSAQIAYGLSLLFSPYLPRVRSRHAAVQAHR